MTSSTAPAAKDAATTTVPATPEAQTAKKEQPEKTAPAANDAKK